MFRRLGARGIALGVIAALVLSAPQAALAQDNTPGPPKPTDCAVENTDDKGNVTITYVPEGTTYGLFHCRGGDWHFGWYPFDSKFDAFTDVIRVDGAGSVKVDEAVVDGRAGEITAGEVKYILDAAGVADAEAPDEAVVSQDGKELYVARDLSEKTSIAELADKAGTSEPTVDFASTKKRKIVITIRCKIWPPSCTITIRW